MSCGVLCVCGVFFENQEKKKLCGERICGTKREGADKVVLLLMGLNSYKRGHYFL